MKIFERIGGFALRYPALQVGLLLGSAIISATQDSLVPAVIQAGCAISLACTVKRWF